MLSQELQWLDDRFGKSHDLLYVDPLFCDPDLNQSLWAELAFWRPDHTRIVHFLRRFMGALHLTSASIATFERELAAKIQSDREASKKAVQVLEEELPALAKHHYPNVAALIADKDRLAERAGDPKIASLVVVDGVFFHNPQNSAQDNGQISKYLQEMVYVSPRKQGSSSRSARGVLVDQIEPLMTLPSELVGLVVNERMYYHWNEALMAVLATGWYPLTRVVGLYAMAGLPLHRRASYLDATLSISVRSIVRWAG